MFKKFFDTIKLNSNIKVKNEALNTLRTDINLCIELMEHPWKKEKTIKTLLNQMRETCNKAIGE